MKKILLLTFGLVSLVTTAQKTIVEEKFEKGNIPFDLVILKSKNSVLIAKGKQIGAVKSISKVNEYFSDLKSVTLVENEKLLWFTPSTIDNSFVSAMHNAMGGVSDSKIFSSDGKLLGQFKAKTNRIKTFSKDFVYSLVNEKDKFIDNIEKEEIYLSCQSVSNNSTKKVKLVKPNFINEDKANSYGLTYVNGYGLAVKKLKEYYFGTKFNNSTFEIYFYKIDGTLKSLTVFKSIYNYSGELLENIKFSLDINKPLIMSDTNGGRGQNGAFLYDESAGIGISNFIQDKDENYYYYGLYGEKEGEAINNNTKGYYVVKFDKKYNLLWKKTYEILDKELLENSSKNNLNSSIDIVNNEIRFMVFKHKYDQYLFYTKIDIKDGKELKTNKVNFNVDSMGLAEFLTTAIPSFFKTKELNNLRLDVNLLYFYNNNQKIKNYLDGLKNTKSKVSFMCDFTKEGIWLIESDNETYYKVTYFNHE